MVIATNLSSLFDLLQCSIRQTRAECCLEFTVVSGYRMFPGMSGSALPPPIVPVRRAMQGSPPISQHQKVKQRVHGRPTGAQTRVLWRVCVCTCATVFRTTYLQNHFATLGLQPLTLRIPKTGPAPLPPREAGLASYPEGTVTHVPGALHFVPN